MKTLLSLLIWLCVIALLAECDSLSLCIIIKSVAGLLLLICGKALSGILTDEEINEEV